jgi:hypothetical protein
VWILWLLAICISLLFSWLPSWLSVPPEWEKRVAQALTRCWTFAKQEREREASWFLNREHFVKFLVAFHDRQSPKNTSLSRYIVRINGQELATTIWTKADYLRINKDALSLKFKWDHKSEIVHPDPTSRYGRRIRRRLESLANVERRLCCGGVGVLVAFKQPEGYLVPIQQRGQMVSDNRGTLALVPKGFHQPVADAGQEVNIRSSVFRELYEEVFGGKEVEGDTDHMDPYWYIHKSEAMKWFWDNNQYICEVVCFGYNQTSGNYEFGVLLVVQDECYWTRYRADMKRMWETHKTFWIDTRDQEKIAEFIMDSRWAQEGLFHFVQCLMRLKEIAPAAVNLPNVSGELRA